MYTYMKKRIMKCSFHLVFNLGLRDTQQFSSREGHLQLEIGCKKCLDFMGEKIGHQLAVPKERSL